MEDTDFIAMSEKSKKLTTKLILEKYDNLCKDETKYNKGVIKMPIDDIITSFITIEYIADVLYKNRHIPIHNMNYNSLHMELLIYFDNGLKNVS
jgi:hypothetical protein